MSSRFPRLVRIATASAIGLTALGGARASTLVQLSVDELCRRATLVVAATAQDRVVVWEDTSSGRGRRIVTYTRMRVDHVIDGTAPPELWVRTLGGSIGDVGQRVDGEAVLAPGQPGLFFLRAFADGPHGVVGMAQGQYLFDRRGGGVAPRLLPMPMLPRLVGPRPAGGVPALRLDGHTLDEASAIIRAARRAHAP